MVIELIAFYLLVFVLGVATFAITFKLFDGLLDRGYAIARVIGCLLLGYIAWILSLVHIAPFSSSVWIAFGLIALGATFAIAKNASIFEFFTKNKRIFIVIEIIFLVSFISMLGLRAFTPNQGPEYSTWGERFDDFAVLNAAEKTTYFPTEHPWLAGRDLHYYYFGQIILASLSKISFLDMNYTYNAGLALLFALLVLGSFGIVYTMTKKVRYGVLAAFFTTVIGNFAGFMQFIKADAWLPYNYWDPSRVIVPYGINEFPFFSFLHADLHAHVIAFPFTVLVRLIWTDQL